MSCRSIRWLASAAVALATASLAPAAQAMPITFKAFLDGAGENPPNASPGTGTATVIFDPVAHTMRVMADFTGLIGTTTAAHVHCCVMPPGTVGVATALPTFPGFPLGVTMGSYDQTFDTTLATTFNNTFIGNNGGTVAGAEAALLAGLQDGRAYFNIHTNAFPGGEIRGFFSEVPEPAAFALFAAALAGLGLVAWRPGAGVARVTAERRVAP